MIKQINEVCSKQINLIANLKKKAKSTRLDRHKIVNCFNFNRILFKFTLRVVKLYNFFNRFFEVLQRINFQNHLYLCYCYYRLKFSIYLNMYLLLHSIFYREKVKTLVTSNANIMVPYHWIVVRRDFSSHFNHIHRLMYALYIWRNHFHDVQKCLTSTYSDAIRSVFPFLRRFSVPQINISTEGGVVPICHQSFSIMLTHAATS